MHVSFSEIETTVCKAAWAAGLALGLGEDAGRSARHLAALGLPTLDAYAAALERLLDGRSVGFAVDRARDGDLVAATSGKDLSALHAGPAARDLLGLVETVVGSLALGSVDRPLLVVGELAVASSDRDTAFRFSAGPEVAGICCGGRVRLDQGTNAAFAGLGPSDLHIAIVPNADASLASRSQQGATPPTAEGHEADEVVWRCLTGLAARRLVAANEASREHGAGAGLIDRD